MNDFYPILPCPKPRMTKRDKWKKRPAVLRYRAFCDECRARGVVLPEDGAEVIFYLPMPKSWSKKKRDECRYKPHQQKPDLSNLIKALEDALYSDDSRVWKYSGLAKYWSETPGISIELKQLKEESNEYQTSSKNYRQRDPG